MQFVQYSKPDLYAPDQNVDIGRFCKSQITVSDSDIIFFILCPEITDDSHLSYIKGGKSWTLAFRLNDQLLHSLHCENPDCKQVKTFDPASNLSIFSHAVSFPILHPWLAEWHSSHIQFVYTHTQNAHLLQHIYPSYTHQLFELKLDQTVCQVSVTKQHLILQSSANCQESLCIDISWQRLNGLTVLAWIWI